MSGQARNAPADIPQIPASSYQFHSRKNSIVTRASSSYTLTSPPPSRSSMDDSKQRQRSDLLDTEDGVSHSVMVPSSSAKAPNEIAALVSSPENIGDRYFRPLSKFDGYQVVLDDGTLKRRTVSLSTLHDVQMDTESHYSHSSDR